VNFMVNLCTWM